MNEFLDALTDSVCIFNAQDRAIFMNISMCKALGYDGLMKEELKVDQVIQLVSDSQDTYIEALTKEREILKGDVHLSKLECQGQAYTYVKVTWRNQLTKEVMLEKLLDAMKEGVALKDENGRYVFVNRAYTKRLGYSKGQIIGKESGLLWNTNYRQKFQKDDEYVRQTGDVCVTEEKMKGRKGNKYYEITRFPVIDRYAQRTYVGIVVKNITISKKLLTQQSESAKQLGYIQNLITDKDILYQNEENLEQLKTLVEPYFKTPYIGFWVYDRNNEKMSATLQFYPYKSKDEKEMNFKVGEVELNNWVKHKCNTILKVQDLYIQDEKETKATVNYLKQMELNYVIVYKITYQDRIVGLLTVAYKNEPIGSIVRNYLVDTMCSQIGLIINNRSLQQEVKKELYERHKMEQELKAFLEISADLIIQVDHEGRYSKVSSKCVHVLGWTEEELLGLGPMDLVHPEDKAISRELLLKCRLRTQIDYPLNLTNRTRCKDGSYKWLRWNVKYIKEYDVFLTTAKDITFEKELQKREQNAQKIVQLEQVRNEFFANLSHEFKTPLTIILSVTKLFEKNKKNWVLEEASQASYTKYLGMVKQNSYRLLRLINNLIDVTKIDAGYLDINLQNYNIVSLVEDIVLSVVQYAKDKNINIVFDTDTEEELIACDLDMIERIMLNLLSNAIKYVNEQGNIHVNIITEQEMILIEVQDDGIGIPSDKIDIIFERFVQVEDVLNRKCEGSGIGLSLVKSLVEIHNGTIQVSSKEGIGSVFRIRLPRNTIRYEDKIRQIGITDPDVRLEKCYMEFSDIYN